MIKSVKQELAKFAIFRFTANRNSEKKPSEFFRSGSFAKSARLFRNKRVAGLPVAPSTSDEGNTARQGHKGSKGLIKLFSATVKLLDRPSFSPNGGF